MANVHNQNSQHSITFQEFLSEAEDIVQALSSNLGKVQTVYVSSGEVNQDIVNTLFRGIHTLKGISAVSGFLRIAALSHKFEDLLDCLRFGRIQLTSCVMDTLFEVMDVLLGLLKNINEQGVERIEIEYIVNKIDGILNNTAPPVNVSSEDLACIDPTLLNRLSEHEIHRLYERLRKGWITYSITISLQVDSIDEDLEMFQGNLTQLGEIITFIPISGFSADTGLSFDIIFVSDEADVESRIYSILKANIISIKKIGSLAPVIESKRQQLSFLGIMPGRESAAPYVRGITKTVRVDIGRLEALLNIVGEALLLHGTVSGAIQGLRALQGCNLSFLDINKGSRGLHKKLSLLRDGLIELRMVPVDYMFDRLSRAAKRLSGELSKEVAVEFSGGDTKLDKSMIEEVADPLMHIIRNAVDHGIECEKIRLERGKPAAGTIKVMASQKERGILIEVEDDGGGIDINKIYDVALGKGLIKRGEQIDEKSLIGFIFQPGFSTSKTVNDVSGRGIGLDVVAKNIAHLSGMIDVDTRSEKGTKFRITLPLTLLIVRALIVSDSGREFAIPFNSISENLILQDSNIKKIGGREVIDVRGNFMPLIRLKDILRFAGDGAMEGGPDEKDNEKDKRYVVVIGVAEKRAGIVVDKIKGQREVLIKPLGKLLCNVSCISGFAEIDAKKILPVLDPLKIII